MKSTWSMISLLKNKKIPQVPSSAPPWKPVSRYSFFRALWKPTLSRSVQTMAVEFLLSKLLCRNFVEPFSGTTSTRSGGWPKVSCRGRWPRPASRPPRGHQPPVRVARGQWKSNFQGHWPFLLQVIDLSHWSQSLFLLKVNDLFSFTSFSFLLQIIDCFSLMSLTFSPSGHWPFLLKFINLFSFRSLTFSP